MNIIYYFVVSYIHPLPLKLFAHSLTHPLTLMLNFRLLQRLNAVNLSLQRHYTGNEILNYVYYGSCTEVASIMKEFTDGLPFRAGVYALPAPPCLPFLIALCCFCSMQFPQPILLRH